MRDGRNCTAHCLDRDHLNVHTVNFTAACRWFDEAKQHRKQATFACRAQHLGLLGFELSRETCTCTVKTALQHSRFWHVRFNAEPVAKSTTVKKPEASIAVSERTSASPPDHTHTCPALHHQVNLFQCWLHVGPILHRELLKPNFTMHGPARRGRVGCWWLACF